MGITAQLLQECLKGSEKGYYKLYELCFSDLMSVCVRYYKHQEDSNSALNKAFLRIVQNLEKYDKDAPWDRWIKRIMINTIINEYQSNKRREELFTTTDYSESYVFDSMSYNDIVETINVDHIKSFIHQLPDNQKQVFNMYAIDGYNHKEISEMLQIPVGTSKWILSEARKKLKQKVEASMNITREVAS